MKSGLPGYFPNTPVGPDGLTERQRDIWAWMRGYQAANHGVPPSFRELMDHFGIRSTNGVHDHLAALQRKGRIALVEAPLRKKTFVAIEPPVASEGASA